MLYYALLDPVTDLRAVNVEHRFIDLYVSVHNREIGSMRLTYAQYPEFVRCFHGRIPVAERDDNDLVSWSADYTKRVVVDENGSLEPTENLR